MIGLLKELRRKRVVDHRIVLSHLMLAGFAYITVEELCVRMGVHMVLDGGFVWLYFVKKGMDSLDAMCGI
jgi:hypothetical protein